MGAACNYYQNDNTSVSDRKETIPNKKSNNVRVKYQLDQITFKSTTVPLKRLRADLLVVVVNQHKLNVSENKHFDLSSSRQLNKALVKSQIKNKSHWIIQNQIKGLGFQKIGFILAEQVIHQSDKRRFQSVVQSFFESLEHEGVRSVVILEITDELGIKKDTGLNVLLRKFMDVNYDRAETVQIRCLSAKQQENSQRTCRHLKEQYEKRK